jgi:hypothetical protein
MILEFAELATANYDEMFIHRRGANLILFNKEESGRWMRKQQSWTEGPMHSPTLHEAIEDMKRNLHLE